MNMDGQNDDPRQPKIVNLDIALFYQGLNMLLFGLHKLAKSVQLVTVNFIFLETKSR